ncbi:cytochrome P450 [Corynespora cassiicola Philippines]|uniref:Cytochrome P450 n=1 Tax=Corynespora cassiicola Philippines TaxID=1448308 RepID=A0A2T2N899_CORCC|nr:cytochrome P450 [Corynespora cassiicola Philippines]
MITSSSLNFFLSILLLAISASVIRVIYNLFLHPLHSFPGPLLARSFFLVSQIQRINGRYHLWLHELHTRYGPVVRVTPNQISTIEPEAWKEIYGHKASNLQKDWAFYGPDAFGSPTGIIRADNVAHSRQRKLVSPAFSDRALQSQEQILKRYAVLLASQLKEKSKRDEPIDMVRWYNFTTFDIMADLTFGDSLKLLENSEYTPWVTNTFGSVKMIVLGSLGREWPLFSKIVNRLIPAKTKEERDRHMRYTVERLEKRLARKTDRPDIWTHVMKYADSEENESKGLHPMEMQSNASTFMFAGTETTATELSGLTYFLLKNPEKLQRLTKEVRDAFPTYDYINMNVLPKLPYLCACIEEGLRIYPPVSIGLPRRTPQGGAQVGCNWFPSGVVMSVPQYAAYHSPLNFKDPDSFVPERWLPEGESEYSSDRKEVLQPFLYGPRNCLGKNLAYHELRLILATTVWHFDLELCPESDGWPDQQQYLLWVKGPLFCRLRSVRG